jgi:predicted glycosyltransferase
MRIFLDIGHPAHVHYFRNFIKIMESRGHIFLVTARKREHVFELLDHYHIPFVSRGGGGKSLFGKIGYLFLAVFKQYRRARKFRPDLFLDFSTIYSGPAARILKKPYITFTDTESTGLYRLLIRPFSRVVYTPECFQRELGKQHQRFNGLMELAYLHPLYFEPDPSILDILGLGADEQFAIVRFVGWGAVHDRGKRGFSGREKEALVKVLQRYGKVFISSEAALPPNLEPLRLQIPSHQMHDLLFYATVLVGESATMTTEAAVLGTPAVFVSDIRLGYLNYLEDKYGLVLNFGTSETEQSMSVRSSAMLMGRPGTKANASRQAEKVLDDHVDVTRFLVDTIDGASGA